MFSTLLSSMQPWPKIQNCRSRLLYKQFARTLESFSFLLSMSTLLENRSANDPCDSENGPSDFLTVFIAHQIRHFATRNLAGQSRKGRGKM